MDEQRKNASAAEADGVIEGRNAVIEALRAGETIDTVSYTHLTLPTKLEV